MAPPPQFFGGPQGMSGPPPGSGPFPQFPSNPPPFQSPFQPSSNNPQNPNLSTSASTSNQGGGGGSNPINLTFSDPQSQPLVQVALPPPLPSTNASHFPTYWRTSLSASGVAHAVVVRMTEGCFMERVDGGGDEGLMKQQKSQVKNGDGMEGIIGGGGNGVVGSGVERRALTNLLTARGNRLTVWEVFEEEIEESVYKAEKEKERKRAESRGEGYGGDDDDDDDNDDSIKGDDDGELEGADKKDEDGMNGKGKGKKAERRSSYSHQYKKKKSSTGEEEEGVMMKEEGETEEEEGEERGDRGETPDSIMDPLQQQEAGNDATSNNGKEGGDGEDKDETKKQQMKDRELEEGDEINKVKMGDEMQDIYPPLLSSSLADASASESQRQQPPRLIRVPRLRHVLTHRTIHGIITSMKRIRVRDTYSLEKMGGGGNNNVDDNGEAKDDEGSGDEEVEDEDWAMYDGEARGKSKRQRMDGEQTGDGKGGAEGGKDWKNEEPDKVLLGFAGGKMALLEWCPEAHDLLPISLHTYEKYLNLYGEQSPPTPYPSLLQSDPSSRCAALLLPMDCLAVLPFFREEIDLELLGLGAGPRSTGREDRSGEDSLGEGKGKGEKDEEDGGDGEGGKGGLGTGMGRSLPYAPSFILDLPKAHPQIRQMKHFVFLPGFNEPTMAILYQGIDGTWTGRLENLTQSYSVSFLTLSSLTLPPSSHQYPLISTCPSLPHTSFCLYPCPRELGGVVVICADGIVWVEQGGRKVVAGGGVNWWWRDPKVAGAPPGPGGRENMPEHLKGTNGGPQGVANEDATNGTEEQKPQTQPRHPYTPTGYEISEDLNACLENCQMVFVKTDYALLFLEDGDVFGITFVRDGRAVSGMRIERLGKGVVASCVEPVRWAKRGGWSTGGEGGRKKDRNDKEKEEGGYLFIGSMVDDSLLTKWEMKREEIPAEIIKQEEDRIAEETKAKSAENAIMGLFAEANGTTESHSVGGLTISRAKAKDKEDDDMDMDMDSSEENEDEDIYGDSAAQTSPAAPASGALGSSETPTQAEHKHHRPRARTRLVLDSCERIPAYGPIRDMTVGPTSKGGPSDLITATGDGSGGGVTLFHRSIPAQKRRRLNLPPNSLRGIQGIWSLPIRRETEVETTPKLDTEAPPPVDNTLVVSTTTGTKFYSTTPQEQNPVLLQSSDVQTVACSGFFQDSCILQVLPNGLRLLNSDLSERQPIEADTGSPIVRATYSDPFLLTTREDKSIDLYRGNMASRQMQDANDLKKVTGHDIVIASVFRDSLGTVPCVKTHQERKRRAAAIERVHPAINEQNVSNPGLEGGLKSGGLQWLVTSSPDGHLRMWELPSLECVFETRNIGLLPQIIEEDIFSVPPPDILEEDFEVDQVHLLYLGRRQKRPHLCIWLRSGMFCVYETVQTSDTSLSSRSRNKALSIRFIKVATRRIPPQLHRKPRRGAGTSELESHRPRRSFVPFLDIDGYSGAFLTGDNPFWLVASDYGPARTFESAERPAFAFTACRREGLGSGYILADQKEAHLLDLDPRLELSYDLPYSKIRVGRSIDAVAFDSFTGTYVAATTYKTKYWMYTDDGDRVWKGEGPAEPEPWNFKSILELLTPEGWRTLHGYEFAQNESVLTLRSVNLSSKSTMSGLRDFIAVGTMINRGEDHSAKGGIYVFEVIKVIPQTSKSVDNFRLRLRYREETKAPVANVHDINGYLIHTLGQKLYIKAWEEDERLLAVGFLDVSTHTTSIKTMKNFILIGDTLKSVSLLAFQEEPYRILVMGKDFRPSTTATADFLVHDTKMAFAATDTQGVLRIFVYDPANAESHAGSRLLLRTEFQTASEVTSTVMFAKRSRTEGKHDQSGILFGTVDGSISTLVPVRDAVYRRLSFLQGQLVRHAQHFSALNPRGFRAVKNDSVSKAINKVILDGDLLATFEWLPYHRQVDLTKQIGTDPETVLLNIKSLAGPW